MPKAKCLSREFGAILIELSYLGAHCLSIADKSRRVFAAGRIVALARRTRARAD